MRLFTVLVALAAVLVLTSTDFASNGADRNKKLRDAYSKVIEVDFKLPTAKAEALIEFLNTQVPAEIGNSMEMSVSPDSDDPSSTVLTVKSHPDIQRAVLHLVDLLNGKRPMEREVVVPLSDPLRSSPDVKVRKTSG